MTSLREIRRELRRLPRERRKDIAEAIRAGRAVNDPRDAGLAVAWAEQLTRTRIWPWWILPRARPHGWRVALWTLPIASMIAIIPFAWILVWSSLPGGWRWIIVAWLVYGAITTPRTIRKMLRAYWNAPRAAEENRRVVARLDQPEG